MRMAVSVSRVFEIWNCNNIKKEILYTSIKLPRITYVGVQLGFSYLAVWIQWTTSNRSQQRLKRDMLYPLKRPFSPLENLKTFPFKASISKHSNQVTIHFIIYSISIKGPFYKGATKMHGSYSKVCSQHCWDDSLMPFCNEIHLHSIGDFYMALFKYLHRRKFFNLFILSFTTAPKLGTII